MSLINLKKVKIALGDIEPKRKTENQIFDNTNEKPKKKKIEKTTKKVKNYGKPEEDKSLKNFLKKSKNIAS